MYSITAVSNLLDNGKTSVSQIQFMITMCKLDVNNGYTFS